jgi:hypothetical protein
MLNQFKISQQNKILCLSFACFLILYYFINKKSAEEKVKAKTEVTMPDTLIPAGHSLVPIQIENSSALNSLIGPFAVVDLYSSEVLPNRAFDNDPTADPLENQQIIFEKVKLIRAPLNANQFAVLVTDEQARQIMQVKQAFFVVLQNRNSLKANLQQNLLQQDDNQPKEKSNVKKRRQRLIVQSSLTKNRAAKARPISVKESKTLPKLAIEYYDKKQL